MIRIFAPAVHTTYLSSLLSTPPRALSMARNIFVISATIASALAADPVG